MKCWNDDGDDATQQVDVCVENPKDQKSTEISNKVQISLDFPCSQESINSCSNHLWWNILSVGVHLKFNDKSTTSLEDLVTATCKLVNLVDHKVLSPS